MCDFTDGIMYVMFAMYVLSARSVCNVCMLISVTWSRSSVTRTHIQCIAFSPCADGSDECKTCDELLALCKWIVYSSRFEQLQQMQTCHSTENNLDCVCARAARVLLLAGPA